MMIDINNPKRDCRVFLGGTCNGSKWRDQLIPLLKVPYFNPVVEDWTPECADEERRQRELCKLRIYTITPKMKGILSIVELTEDSLTAPDRTLVCFLKGDEDAEFDEAQWKSIKQATNNLKERGGRVCFNLEELANTINLLLERDF